VIYETKEWDHDLQQSPAKIDCRFILRKALQFVQFTEGEAGQHTLTLDECRLTLSVHDLGNAPIVRGVCLHRLEDHKSPHLSSLPSFCEERFPTSLNNLSKRAVRAYGEGVLESESTWGKLREINQRHQEACLPLSEEQLEVLQRFERPNQLPAFLDGSAGSGKSSLLTYLFAFLLDRAKIEKMDFEPLFVTYGDQLCEDLRQRVQGILLIHFPMWAEEEAKAAVRRTITTLGDLQLAQLDKVDERSRFVTEGRVSFHRFRREFDLRGLAPELSYEETWLILRAFWKGYASLSEDGEQSDTRYFTIEDFYDLPKTRKDNLDDSHYKLVISTLAKRYQKWLDDNKLWDDQDLTLAALHAIQRQSNNRYSALIVDEAQDLTRNDFRFLSPIFASRLTVTEKMPRCDKSRKR